MDEATALASYSTLKSLGVMAGGDVVPADSIPTQGSLVREGGQIVLRPVGQ